MKYVKFLLLTTLTVFFIVSCQRELNFDTDGLAHGTLKANGTGECLPTTINGIYEADSVLDNTNFIDIHVNLTSTGTYDIKSDTINGYSFRGTGTLGNAGDNTVRLYATGTPIVSGSDVFTISFDGTTCQVDVLVIGVGTGVAVYTLGGAPSICSGFILNSNGIYKEGVALDVNNTVTLTVNVTALGTYVLGAASVNGMLFTATGVFTQMGNQSVTLNGSGTPAATGTFNIDATNGTSTCTFSIEVLPAGPLGPAVYSLNVSGADCAGATNTGVYTAGTLLTGAAVVINVNVTTLGTYTITTTNNGITFSATGTFNVIGAQPVTLTGSGTPTTAGIFNFNVDSGTSTCTFSITVAAPPVVNEDYIPQTDFSNWSDKLVGGTAADTSYLEVNPNSSTVNGISYKIFEYKELGTPVDTVFHRKEDLGKYYQLFDNSYGFDNNFSTDGLLLDSSLAVNATWDINLGNNTAGGIPVTGKIVCLITQKAATATIAGNTYTNIIKVTYTYNYDAGTGDNPFAKEEIWYAKGKGVVNYIVNDLPLPATFTDVWETTRIVVY